MRFYLKWVVTFTACPLGKLTRIAKLEIWRCKYTNFSFILQTFPSLFSFSVDFPWKFQLLFLSLHHRLAAHSWAAGGLIYEKDVFERLSLWTTNFANSTFTAGRWQRDVYVVRPYIPYYIVRTGVGWWALSILCEGGNAKACSPRMGRRTDTYAFFVYLWDPKTID